jgi:hypothetical protein
MMQLLASPFGSIEMPPGVSRYSPLGGSGQAAGLVPFLNNILKLFLIIGGVYALINIILAGYGFLSAGDDPKKIQSATAKIWQSLIGLLIMAGAFALAAIFGYLIFGSVTAILIPHVYGPGV